MPDVLCIGNASYDISVFVDTFPVENSKGETDRLLEAGGGPAANAAYLLSSWGVSCAFAGLIGNDDYGRRIAAEFQAVHTDLSCLELRPGYATPVSVILVNRQTGSRTIINRKARNGGRLELATAPLAAMQPKVLLFDGHEPSASVRALECFPAAVSILDAGSRREGTVTLAPRVRYLVASERFACQTCHLDHLDSADDRRSAVEALGPRPDHAVVITLGQNGLVADDGTGFRYLLAFPARAVDTTAAGDIFHGAFAYGTLHGLSFDQTLRFSSLAASLSVAREGGRPSIPSLAEMRKQFREEF